MRISDWSSDVCSSDLNGRVDIPASRLTEIANVLGTTADMLLRSDSVPRYLSTVQHSRTMPGSTEGEPVETNAHPFRMEGASDRRMRDDLPVYGSALRSEEHTSELQSLMRISYDVFCLQKKKT